MAFIVTFVKSPRLSARDRLFYISRDLGGYMMLLPWWIITIHQGDWRVEPVGARLADPEATPEAMPSAT
jgi:hypothetical protein